MLSEINDPKDLKKLAPQQLPELAEALRRFIIAAVAVKEGHLGASLGTVELTIALHYVFNTPKDKLVWDVGHQAYGHKILTGRRDQFDSNRQLGGISGFPKRDESVFDDFGTGHSSTSISAILGMAIAAGLQGKRDRAHIAVIGDASIASGMAFEALNHLGETDANVLVILNDNAIGIDPSVGALKRYLTNVKLGTAKEENLFECLNLGYSGPIDGHDLTALVSELERQRDLRGPRLLHVVTTKGKGLPMAEKDQVTYHAPGRFDVTTGERLQKIKKTLPPKFQDVFGLTLVALAKTNSKIVGITPAMPTGSSLKYMMEAFPDRAFDVGIAEQHAVTLAAGLATQGMVPFCAIYSTFLQRAYDQVIHDVALQQLPVVFCLDRAGLVGQDGPTHHGVYDIAYLRCIPNLIIFSPLNEIELRNILYTAQQGLEGPIAIRYPRGQGNMVAWDTTPMETIPLGKAVTMKRGTQVAFLTFGPLGTMVARLIEEQKVSEKYGHYNMRFAKPIDESLLHQVFANYDHIITVEDGSTIGGFGSAVLEFANDHGYHKTIKRFGVPDRFIAHGTQEELHDICDLHPNQLKTYLENYT
ncbi:MAG: 1-deoxy-D-xylulose-5-phosphate synthase [Bacteroidota bacterium]